MAKIKVKLNDPETIFHDIVGKQTITGEKAVEVTPTPRITKALRHGRLIKIEKTEEKKPAKSKEPAKSSDDAGGKGGKTDDGKGGKDDKKN